MMQKSDRFKAIVIGLGETGGPLYGVLVSAYPGQIFGYDIRRGQELLKNLANAYEFLNICLPYGPGFLRAVRNYQERLKPKLTIVHSTVPVGTTAKLKAAVHSPILGRHKRMAEELKEYVKWVGGSKANEAALFLSGAGMRCRAVTTSEETELLKLTCLAKYGLSLAFTDFQERLCARYKVPFRHVIEWDKNYNEHVAHAYRRPILIPPKDGKIGGHCVVPGSRILNSQFPNPMLKEILRHG
jgi:hypothetical protein